MPHEQRPTLSAAFMGCPAASSACSSSSWPTSPLRRLRASDRCDCAVSSLARASRSAAPAASAALASASTCGAGNGQGTKGVKPQLGEEIVQTLGLGAIGTGV